MLPVQCLECGHRKQGRPIRTCCDVACDLKAEFDAKLLLISAIVWGDWREVDNEELHPL